jgi:hypothetical protein
MYTRKTAFNGLKMVLAVCEEIKHNINMVFEET